MTQPGGAPTIEHMRTPVVSSAPEAVQTLRSDQSPPEDPGTGALEHRFDRAFMTRLALREKQIQQHYRPVIGIHKWFARRPGSVFRSLLLAEFAGGDLADAYWEPHALSGTIANPFMG